MSIPIISQKIIANFDASKTSSNKALIKIAGTAPTTPATNPNSTPLKLLPTGNFLIIIFASLINIAPKAKNPNKPTSPNSLKKSLSVASVIDEYPVPNRGFLDSALIALGHSTLTLIEVERSSKIGTGVGVGVAATLLCGKLKSSF